jgi:GntR family transcriptional regulator
VLPPIEDLAAEAGITKSTARQAIAVLEAEGLVEAVRRRGTVVRPRTDRTRPSSPATIH